MIMTSLRRPNGRAENVDKIFVAAANTQEFLEAFFGQAGTDAVAHVPGRAVGTGADDAVNLQGGDPVLAGQHEVNDLEPLAERVIGVFENRADKHGEAIALRGAVLALPMERLRQLIDFVITAARAANTLRPTGLGQIGF